MELSRQAIADQLRSWLSDLTRAGGLQFDEPRPVVLARVEDPDRTDFPADELITGAVFDEILATYDPERRAAPVVAGVSRELGVAGPAHWAGQDLPPLGVIRGTDWHVDRDDLNLYGQVAQIVDPSTGRGRVDDAVLDGILQRSVFVRMGSKETDGKAQLWHLALLAGEQPGIPNMDPLTRYGFGNTTAERSAEWRSLGLKPAALREVRCRAYSILDDLLEDHEMTPEQQKQLQDGIVGAVREAVSGEVAKIEKALSPLSTLGDTLKSSLAPVTERLERVETEAKETEAKATEATEAAKAAKQEATDQRRAGIRQRLERLVRGGTLMPFQATKLAASLLDPNTPDSVVEASLDSLERTAETSQGRVTTELRIDEGHTARVDFGRTFHLGGKPMQVPDEQLEVLARAQAKVREIEDPKARQRAFEAFLYDYVDGPSINFRPVA